MTYEIAHSWLAAHLYYAPPWEAFLVNSLKPFVGTIFDRDLAEQFFFIRYWERGPHIRLRFKSTPQKLTIIQTLMNTHFHDYFAAHPSQQEEPAYSSDMLAMEEWYPNHSIQIIPYKPEFVRYGGPHGVSIAEKQFQLSSSTILDVLSKVNEWNYEWALGTAVQIHLSFAFAMGMDLDSAQRFFSLVASSWFSMAYGFTDGLPPQELVERQKTVLQAFAHNFSLQKATLVPYLATLWEALQQGEIFEKAWINRWIVEMTFIRQQLHTAMESGNLVIPQRSNPNLHYFLVDNKTKIASSDGEPIPILWNILESYVHMTNNRLGILNRDEAFLGYLLASSLQKMVGQAAR